MPYNYNEDYFRDHLSGWHAGSFPKIKLLLETYLAGSSNLHILDLGCGDGIYGQLLRSHATWVAGIEGSPDAVAVAKSRGSYDQVLVGDLATKNGLVELINKGNFDVVFTTEVIEHVEEYTNMLALARSALKTGGRLMLTTTMYYHFIFHAAIVHRSALTPRALAEYVLGFWSLPYRQKFIRRFWDYTGGHYHGFSRRMLTKALEASGFSLEAFEWLYAESGICPTFSLRSDSGQLHERFIQRGFYSTALAKAVLHSANALNGTIERHKLPAGNCFLVARAV